MENIFELLLSDSAHLNIDEINKTAVAIYDAALAAAKVKKRDELKEDQSTPFLGDILVAMLQSSAKAKDKNYQEMSERIDSWKLGDVMETDVAEKTPLGKMFSIRQLIVEALLPVLAEQEQEKKKELESLAQPEEPPAKPENLTVPQETQERKELTLDELDFSKPESFEIELEGLKLEDLIPEPRRLFEQEMILQDQQAKQDQQATQEFERYHKEVARLHGRGLSKKEKLQAEQVVQTALDVMQRQKQNEGQRQPELNKLVPQYRKIIALRQECQNYYDHLTQAITKENAKTKPNKQALELAISKRQNIAKMYLALATDEPMDKQLCNFSELSEKCKPHFGIRRDSTEVAFWNKIVDILANAIKNRFGLWKTEGDKTLDRMKAIQEADPDLIPAPAKNAQPKPPSH